MIRSAGFATVSIVIIAGCAVCTEVGLVTNPTSGQADADAIFTPLWNEPATTGEADLITGTGTAITLDYELLDFLTSPSARLSKSRYARAAHPSGSQIFVSRFAIQDYEFDLSSPPPAINDQVFNSDANAATTDVAAIEVRLQKHNSFSPKYLLSTNDKTETAVDTELHPHENK